MPSQYRYFEAKKLVLSEFWGVVSAQDILHLIRGIATDERIGPGTRELVDLRRAERVEASQEDFCKIADFNRQVQKRREDYRTAFVSSNDITYGMARMYEILVQMGDTPLQTGVFRTVEQAARWLDVELPSGALEENGDPA